MELEAIKHDLIQWIVSLNDPKVIQELRSMQEAQQANDADFWNTLSPPEQSGLEEAQHSLRLGEGKTWEEIRAGIKEEFGF